MAGGGTSILVYKAVGALLAKTSAASMMVGIFGSAGGGAAGTLNAVRSIQDTGDVQLRKCARKTVIDSSIVGAAVGSVGALGVPLQGREDPVGQIVIHTMNVYVADEKVTNLTQPEGL